MTEHIVIVGAGLCGARAAFALRGLGFAGSVTLVGEELLPPYERPPLSKQTLIDEPEPRVIANAEDYRSAGIRLMTGERVEAIDRAGSRVRLAGGEDLAYDRLLLATGARPRPFPGVAEGSERILTLRSHGDAATIRSRLVPGVRLAVIGGGFIGLELAATARRLCAEVTVIEGQPRLLSRGVPAEVAAVVEARHKAEGVKVLCGTAIASLTEEPDEVSVQLADGRVVRVDLVVVGIGAIPNTALAEESGLAIENGISVDGRLATSDPKIFAAGDCCSFPLALYGDRRVRLESWRNAQDQGLLAAANMLGDSVENPGAPWFWSDQYDLTLQIAGLAEGASTTVRRDLGDEAFILFHLDPEGRLLAASGIGRGNAVARDIRLAEMLIAARAYPDPASLASADTKLKKLLAA